MKFSGQTVSRYKLKFMKQILFIYIFILKKYIYTFNGVM